MLIEAQARQAIPTLQNGVQAIVTHEHNGHHTLRPEENVQAAIEPQQLPPTSSNLEVDYHSALEVDPNSFLPQYIPHSELEETHYIVGSNSLADVESGSATSTSRKTLWITVVVAIVVISAIIGGSVGGTVGRRHSST
jgi:hypothetical protein